MSGAIHQTYASGSTCKKMTEKVDFNRFQKFTGHNGFLSCGVQRESVYVSEKTTERLFYALALYYMSGNLHRL
jgi:hypothetical protein